MLVSIYAGLQQQKSLAQLTLVCLSQVPHPAYSPVAVAPCMETCWCTLAISIAVSQGAHLTVQYEVAQATLVIIGLANQWA